MDTNCSFELLGKYKLYQGENCFRLGSDALRLAAFATVREGNRVCDLGCASGALPLLLLGRAACRVTGVELDARAAALARRNILENELADVFSVVEGDLRNVRALLPAASFDLVVCNPPYFPAGSGKLPQDMARAAARAEVSLTLPDVCRAAAWLLPHGGRFALCHRPERLTDVLCALREARLEPKRLRLSGHAGGKPNLILAEAVRGARPGLDVEAEVLP
ncbi:MAG TPA: methyltransferase [Oscillospiraceae bacterium]|nr:methyltransferase [Oscillospiraceae bacterium]